LVKAGSGLVTFGNTSSAGVPESFVNETIVVSLNNKKAVEEAFSQFKDQIACIIIEPIPANEIPVRAGNARASRHRRRDRSGCSV
jgi:glutamate-1-semialdehyde 2,1-aminomutase